MTTLVLGTVGSLVGGAVGGAVGAQVGWLLGSLLGNLIDPPKVEGPRRSDLKLQVSEYGKPIPIVYGLGRIAGNVIDQTDLEEHKETDNGKGGPEVTKYTYSASFAIMLCEGPIKGVRRIWADSRLIWAADDGTDMPCTLYLGTEDQLPDPTFEAIHGVGLVPAYRGKAYVVFTDYMLTDFGDRIPMLEFEVYTEEGTIPWRVNSFRPWEQGGISNYFHSNGTLYDGLIIATDMTNNAPVDLIRRKFDYQGNQIGDTLTFNTGQDRVCAVYNSSLFVTYTNNGDGSGDILWWQYDPQMDTFSVTSRWTISGFSYGAILKRATKSGDYIYGHGHRAFSTYITRFAYNGGAVAEYNVMNEVYLGEFESGNITFMATDDDDGSIYLWYTSEIGNENRIWHYDSDFNLLHFWDTSDTASLPSWFGSAGVPNSFVWHDLMIVPTDEGSIGGGDDINNIRLVKINSDYSLEEYGEWITHDNTLSNYIGNGLMMDSVGIYSLIPPPKTVTLASIVADLSDRTDINGAYDVSELTDEVRWFAVSNQMTVRNAIDTLRKGFMFDAVESDDIVKFRKRGATDSVVTIDDDDLGARPFGSENPELLQTIRKKEKGMPRTVTLRYIDVDADYSTGAQSSPRLTTLSDQDTSIDLSIGFKASEALQKCWALQVGEWIERETFAWETSRKYCWVEPCDVVTVRGRVIRITQRTETPDGLMKWEGVLHRPSIYTQEQTGSSGSGENSQPSVPNPPHSGVGTQVVLMDMPLVSFSDYPYGFYAAGGPAYDGSWSGWTLYKSIDGGANWVAVYSSSTQDVIGVTTTAVGSPPIGSPSVYGVLSAYSGGDIVEEATICIELTSEISQLVTTNSQGLSNGANLCAISRGYAAGSPTVLQWEILQFRDAQQIDAKTWLISGFLRGRKGTSTSGHASGDTFVLLPVGSVDAPAQEMDVPLLYKAVSFGHALADSPAFVFTNTGQGLQSYVDNLGEVTPPFVGDTGSPSAPVGGAVPAPQPGDAAAYKFLHANGTWQPVAPPYASYIVRSLSGILQNESVLTQGARITISDGGGSPPTTTTISADLQFVSLTPTFNTTLTVDLANYSNYPHVLVDVTLTDNFTFNISNGTNGQIIRVRFKQDGTGGRLITAGANLRFSADITSLTLSTSANKIDRIAFEWHGVDSKADVIAVNKGY